MNKDEITAEVAARQLLAVAQAKNLTYSGRPRPSYVAAKAEMKITRGTARRPRIWHAA